MTLTALIIDDEQLAREELEFLLEGDEDLEILGHGSNGIEAVDLIRTHRPDVVFLDVQMPGLDGFAVLRKLLEGGGGVALPQIVFATAFDRYAVRAFDVNAIDYLLKPFDKQRVLQALARARTRVLERNASRAGEEVTTAEDLASTTSSLSSSLAGSESQLFALLKLIEQNSASKLQAASKIVLQAGSRLLLVDQKDICFAAIDDGTITVTTSVLEGQSRCRTLEELLELLDPSLFWRAHRSFVVNLNHIREVVPWFKSSYQLRMDDKKSSEIPVSRTQTRRLRELFKL
ncbi:LytTR family DNA-binding domain-containing protein [Acidipila sp. EB88]|uniref:LytR/AlgR family response regulator transcription factor n=1 Tax=Acidipila sp. EB88 TaxID=2305226 RepID=UPI000F5FF799|nr:response regulator transcription factor [Acidipila sp. EB88]RRA48586.1 DNA-binding response regulator [Acidipila sp. EB88]